MNNMTTIAQSKQPVLKAWEASSGSLPRLLIKGYTREEVRREYRARYNLHDARVVDVKEITDGNANPKS